MTEQKIQPKYELPGVTQPEVQEHVDWRRKRGLHATRHEKGHYFYSQVQSFTTLSQRRKL